MALNLDRLRKKQSETSRQPGKFWKAQDGVKNCIRVYKYSHKITKEDIKQDLFPKKDLGVVVEELDRVVERHFNIRADKHPVLSCPALKKEIAAMDKEEARTKRAQRSFFMNIVDTLHPEEGVKMFACPKTVYDVILTYIIDPEYGEEMLGSKGRDFVVIFDPKKPPASMYQVQVRKEGMSKPLPSDLDKGVLDLYLPEAYSQMGEKYETEAEAEVETEGEAKAKIEELTDEDDGLSDESPLPTA